MLNFFFTKGVVYLLFKKNGVNFSKALICLKHTPNHEIKIYSNAFFEA